MSDTLNDYYAELDANAVQVDCNHFQPNSDVSGIGIIVSYILTSFVIQIACFIYTYCTWGKHEDIQINPAQWPKTSALGKLIVDVVDDQPILAAALVLGLYTTKSHTSVYHTRMVQYLISSQIISTFLAVGYNIRRMRFPWYRLLGLTVMVVMFIVPHATKKFQSAAVMIKELQQCLNTTSQWPPSEFDKKGLTLDLAIIGAFMFGAAIFYWSKLGNDRESSSRLRKRSLCRSIIRAIAYFYVFMFAAAGVSAVIWNAVMMVRVRGLYIERTKEVENDWGFGQMLAIALLLRPFFQFFHAMKRGLIETARNQSLRTSVFDDLGRP